MLKTYLQKQKAVISLILIWMIAFLGLATILTVSFLSSSDLRLASQDHQANQAFYLSQACAEIALIKLKQDINYTGSENINIQESNCQIETILGTGDENRVIQTISSYQNQVRKIQINLSLINPQIQITAWQEIADF